MYRVLPALMVAFAVIMGAIPTAATLAAQSRRTSHLSNQPPHLNGTVPGASRSRWAMVKPDIPITTQMVIPQNSVSGSSIARFALRYVGYPYTLTGNAPSLGFSCIGLVSYVYQSLGIPLPDELGNARAYAPPVAVNDLRPGDILWFGNTVWPGLSHTAIYLGGGRFVHAAWYSVGVIVSSFQNDPRYGNYWTEHYMGASRPWGGAGSRTPAFSATIDHYLFPNSLEVLPHVPAVLVTAPLQALRLWWSLRAPVVREVSQATPLITMQRRGPWYQVMTPDGASGWVPSASRVSILAADGSSPAQAAAPARVPRHAPAKRAGRRRTLRAGATSRLHARMHSPGHSRRKNSTSAPLHRIRTQRSHLRTGTRSVTSNTHRALQGTVASLPAPGNWVVAGASIFLRASTARDARIVSTIAPGASYLLIRSVPGRALVVLTTGRQGWISVRPAKSVAKHSSPRQSHVRRRSAHPVHRTKARKAIHRQLHRVRKSVTGRHAHLLATVRFHARPGLHGPVLRLLKQGTTVRVLGRRDGWTHIRLRSGGTGYVSAAYVG
jgi:cell wall-associated NlpC family hydrolase/SH3-like domain-containing protein